MIRRDPRLMGRPASALHGAAPERGPVVAEAPVAVDQPVAPEPALEAGPAAPVASRSGRRLAWVMALAVSLLLAGAVAWGFLKFLNGPVQAGAVAPLPTHAGSASPTPTTNQLAGLYFDMIYPGIFDQVGQLKNDAQSLEQYNISSKKDYRRVMAVNVRPLPSGLLEDDSSYKLRRITPADYKERADKLHGEPVAVMSKADKSEVTLFWAHKGKLLTIAITSTNPNDDVAGFMTALEPNLRWRE